MSEENEYHGKPVKGGEFDPAVMPPKPWRVWWQGSGERGDHVMCDDLGKEIAFFPAPAGTEGSHDAVGQLVYEHNCAVERLEQHHSELLAVLERMVNMHDLMMKKVNHGASFYDAKCLQEMNEAPKQAREALAKAGAT